MQSKTAVFWQRAAIAVLPVVFVAVVSSFFTRVGDLWYQTLEKPLFTPPQWAFPVAWGIVYVCLMASLYLIQRVKGFDAVDLIVPIVAISALNIAWSLLFFGLHLMLPAALVLLALLGVLVVLLLAARSICPASAYLLLPHILWGGFALALNVGFWLVNRM